VLWSRLVVCIVVGLDWLNYNLGVGSGWDEGVERSE